jgi:hypothetical protein
MNKVGDENRVHRPGASIRLPGAGGYGGATVFGLLAQTAGRSGFGG